MVVVVVGWLVGGWLVVVVGGCDGLSHRKRGRVGAYTGHATLPLPSRDGACNACMRVGTACKHWKTKVWGMRKLLKNEIDYNLMGCSTKRMRSRRE